MNHLDPAGKVKLAIGLGFVASCSIGAFLAVAQHHGWLSWMPHWMLPPS